MIWIWYEGSISAHRISRTLVEIGALAWTRLPANANGNLYREYTQDLAPALGQWEKLEEHNHMLSNHIQDIWPLLLIFSDLQLAFLHLPGLSPTFRQDFKGIHREQITGLSSSIRLLNFEIPAIIWVLTFSLEKFGPRGSVHSGTSQIVPNEQCRIATAVDPKCCNYCTVCSTQLNTCIIMANANVTHPNLDPSFLSSVSPSAWVSWSCTTKVRSSYRASLAPQNGPNSWKCTWCCTWWKSWWTCSSIFWDTKSTDLWSQKFGLTALLQSRLKTFELTGSLRLLLTSASWSSASSARSMTIPRNDNVTWVCLKTMGKLPKSNGSLSLSNGGYSVYVGISHFQTHPHDENGQKTIKSWWLSLAWPVQLLLLGLPVQRLHVERVLKVLSEIFRLSCQFNPTIRCTLQKNTSKVNISWFIALLTNTANWPAHNTCSPLAGRMSHVDLPIPARIFMLRSKGQQGRKKTCRRQHYPTHREASMPSTPESSSGYL